MIRRLPAWLRWLLYLALPLLIIYFTLNVLLTSTVFSRFVLDRVEALVPELEFTQVHGNFIRGLSLDLRYQSADQDVQVLGVQLQLGLECLWQMKLCIRRLHADHVQIVLSASDEEKPEPEPDGLELPEVELPLEIELRSISVGRLQIVQGGASLYQLKDLDGALSWQESTLSVARLALADDWCRWTLEGQIALRDFYPLDAALSCESTQDLGIARADIGGDLRQLQLDLDAQILTPYSAEAAAVSAALRLAVLDADLPIAAQIRLAPLELELAERIIRLRAAELTLDGPLLAPAIQAALNFESPFWAGVTQLTLAADASTEALQIHRLLLQLPEGQLTVAGLLDYSEAINWQGQINWRDIELEQFAEGFSGRIHGNILSDVDYRDERLRAELSLGDVGGRVLDWSFSAGGRLRYGDEVLQLEDLDLRQGDNRIQLAGDLSLEQEASNLHLSLDLPQLRQLIPEQWLEQFDGALEGELQLTGSLEQPALEGRMVARNIEYGDINLQRGDLSLNWQGADQPDVNFSLQLDRLGFGEDLLAQLSLSGQGRQAVHSLIVEAQGLAQHQDKRLALQCHGGFTGALGAAWDGECSRLDIDFALSEPQQWRLQQPLQLTVDPSVPELALSAFCLTYQNASLCSERGIEYRSDSLSPIEVVGENFAAHWFQNFVPAENLQLAGNWGVRFSGADMLSDDRRLSASLSSSDLAAIWNEPGSQLRLQAQTLGLEWTMVQQHHQLSWILDTVDSGSSRGELSLIDQAIEGSLSISGVDLGDYGHLFLAADDEVAGQLEASLAVSGTLAQPVLNGEVNLAGGRFRSDLLPVPLEDIQFQLAIRDNIAGIDGQYRAANSRGRLGGEFRWAGLDWSGNMTIAAEPLLIQPEPTMKIYVAPDLRFDFEPSRITISGSVAVPRAELEITELPEQAISVSSDTVIVGAAESEEGTALQVLVNIELQLGNRVAFEGFGLETNITGKLRLQQRSGEMMRANGRLSLVEGRYNAYGQNLVIRSGDLVFVGDIDNPQLRVEAVRGDTPETVTVGLRASGPARNPRVSLFSQPDMPQQAQLSYLITGSPPGAGDLDPQMAAAEAALNFALDSGIGSGITRRAGDALGIEDLHVSAGSTDNGTQIGLSGYVTPRLLVRYGVGVFDTINTWTLRYQVSRSVYLEAITGEASDIGVMWSFERN